MHDTIKITVIATGFDQTRQRLEQFVRVDKKEEDAGEEIAPKEKSPASEDEDVFEIPAFLRQRN